VPFHLATQNKDRLVRIRILATILAASLPAGLRADWPTWRADAARSGQTSETLAGELPLQWTWRSTHPPQTAWPRDDRMAFDRVYRVVAAHGMVYFGSSADDTVYALDAATGALKWTYCTDGPVRFAPTVWKDRLYVVSDDGFLYALRADDGTLIERWRGGLGEDRVLGNGRIVSKWVARSGPVIHDGILYWGAGIWQAEGIYLRAMNADTGEVLWTNDSSGGIEMGQPHGGAVSKSGVSAQGYLMANADRLFVTTGRAVPAAFTRASGAFEYYRLQENTQRGSTQAMLSGDYFYNGGYAYQNTDGAPLADRVDGVVAVLGDGVVHGTADKLRALKVVIKELTDRRGNKYMGPAHDIVWQVDNVPSGTAIITTANAVVTSHGRRVALVDAASREIVWSHEVDADALELAVADGRLLVSTTAGTISCFGPESVTQPAVQQARREAAPFGDNANTAAAAAEIIRLSGIKAGYCVDLGCGDGSLAYELARQTDLHVVAIDPDPEHVAAARRKLAAAGLYGVRVCVHQGDPAWTHFPKYFANLVVSGRSLQGGPAVVDAAEAHRLQRPYGGVACLGKPGTMQVAVGGPLEKAGEWTHLYADASNTVCSADEIKGPLSVLWYRDVDLELPQRHGRGPGPLYHDGRLFAEGLDGVRAVDAYNGRPLWHFDQPGILDAYNADHLAGTAITGSNMCIAGDSLYLRNKDKCFRVDCATGTVRATYTTPAGKDGKPGDWGYIACVDGVLYGSISNTEHIVRHAYLKADAQMQQQYSESSALFAIDVDSGRQLWRYDAEKSIRNNAIAIGQGRVFLIDRALAKGDLLSNAAVRRGEEAPKFEHPHGTLITLDAKTGERKWDNEEEIFGTSLAVSAKHDLLLMFYQSTRFKLPSEVGGRMAVFHIEDGYRLWDKPVNYDTRPLINDETIIAWPSQVDLLSGDSKPTDLKKTYGCGQLSGSKNLLMFRSGTLSYADLSRDTGVMNFGGVRPGCWINSLPVGGLVLVPDASAGCQCSYQNRSWVALEGSE
jgi:outer membrane protein assembly factor BamB